MVTNDDLSEFVMRMYNYSCVDVPQGILIYDAYKINIKSVLYIQYPRQNQYKHIILVEQKVTISQYKHNFNGTESSNSPHTQCLQMSVT